MEMVNVVGYLDDLDTVSTELVHLGCVHTLNAFDEIRFNNLDTVTPDEDSGAPDNVKCIRPYGRQTDYSAAVSRLFELMNLFGIERVLKKKYSGSKITLAQIAERTELIYSEVEEYLVRLERINKELARIEEFQGYMECLSRINIDLDILKDLNYFNFSFGKLSKENYAKYNDNDENISSIVFEVSSTPSSSVLLILTPRVYEDEVNRIMKSLNFEEIKIPYGLSGTPDYIIDRLVEKVKEQEAEIESINSEIDKLHEKYGDFVDESYSVIKMLEKVQNINDEVVCTNEFFYLTGWVPSSQKDKLEERFTQFGGKVMCTFKHQSQINKELTPPTRLKNNWFVRPFEALIKMYGLPSYSETDPTIFMALSYMVMYGCMFGDLGQGFVFFLAGILLSTKFKRPNLGGVLARIGTSSMVFGVLFGSVFGMEGIIHPLLMYPMENINTVLIGGMGLGIILSSVGIMYNLVNSFKRKDIEEGAFGKNGLTGLLFYWTIIFAAVGIIIRGEPFVPMPVIVVLVCILLGFMVAKKPVTHLIMHKRPLLDEPPSAYYVESGLGIFETLLSMMSNTVSFVRVGAFALNHVGLFMAFIAIAEMINSGGGSTAVLILGNIIVIALEGLCVFVQCLRLEYYELFSKYYNGSGIEYDPVKLRYSARAEAAVKKLNLNRNTDGISNKI